MKAIVCTKYGSPDVLKLEEVAKPVPGADEVLVEVRAAAVTFSNLMLVRGEPFVGRLMGLGLLRPKEKIPGSDIAMAGFSTIEIASIPLNSFSSSMISSIIRSIYN